MPAAVDAARIEPDVQIMIRNERLTASLDGDFVVFLIGLRINKPLHIHKWLPVVQAMPRMLTEDIERARSRMTAVEIACFAHQTPR